VAFSVVAVMVVLALIWKMGRQVNATTIALALILGGAIGNMYDRIRYAYVVDFIEIHIVHYHWPDFNAADSAIVIGACLLFLEVLRPQRQEI
jgi:signal peptidase II